MKYWTLLQPKSFEVGGREPAFLILLKWILLITCEVGLLHAWSESLMLINQKYMKYTF